MAAYAGVAISHITDNLPFGNLKIMPFNPKYIRKSVMK